MAAITSMLARVCKLERARSPVRSPFEQAFGSMVVFDEEVRAGILEGTLDAIDMPFILACVYRWHTDRVWDRWQHDRVWNYAG